MQPLPRNLHSFEYGTGRAPPRWMLFPAYTALPFLRAPLGYDLLKPDKALGRALMIAGLGVAGQCVMTPRGDDFAALCGFAGAYVAVSLLRFLRRWRGQAQGENIHTAEAGYSFLARLLPLPPAVTETLILPALIGLWGWMLLQGGARELGVWLMLAAVSLSRMGLWECRRRWSQHRAMTDDVVRGESYRDLFQARQRRRGRAG